MILRWGTVEEKLNYIKKLQKEAETIIQDVIALIYYMRGAVTYTEAMYMTYAERRIVDDFLKKRFEFESKRPNPIY